LTEHKGTYERDKTQFFSNQFFAPTLFEEDLGWRIAAHQLFSAYAHKRFWGINNAPQPNE